MPQITIPYNYTPRAYQRPLFEALDNGYKRVIAVLHRRAGKDLTCINLMVREMLQRVGYYLYILPTASLARRVVWNGATKDGMRFLDCIPPELIKRKQDQTMMIELINGSIFQLAGSDRFINVGINPLMVIFSEYSLQDPSCWNYLRPVLAENDGIAVFQGTPRGRNHLYTLWEMAEKNSDWFTIKLTADDTGAISKEALQAELDAGMSPELYEQEFFVSFNRGIEGSYYGRLIDTMRREGRIGNIPIETVETHVAFDLGMDDSTVMWFWQNVGAEVRFIDYYENNGQALEHYVRVMRDKGYIYGNVWLPHDARIRELSSGVSRLETMVNLGVKTCDIVDNIPLMDGIESVRQLLKTCWIDETRCKQGLDCLEMYHKEYLEKKGCYADRPVHDKWSHGADAMRYASIVCKRAISGGSDFEEYNESLRPRC